MRIEVHTPRIAGGSLKTMTFDSAQKAIDSVLRNFPNAPQIELEADARKYLPAGSTEVPKGITLPDGKVVVFINGADSARDVAVTVFHEMFHRGCGMTPYCCACFRQLPTTPVNHSVAWEDHGRLFDPQPAPKLV